MPRACRGYLLRLRGMHSAYITEITTYEINSQLLKALLGVQWFNLVKPKTYIVYHQLLHSEILCCAHGAFMCFVWISEQTAIISLYGINLLVFKTKAESVYCAVRNGSLNQIQFRRVNAVPQCEVACCSCL